MVKVDYTHPERTGDALDGLLARLSKAERLIEAIEDELGDAALTDDLRLDRIGERVAGYRDDEEARAAHSPAVRT